MAYSPKYGTVTFERGDIRDDEIVFVIRGDDLAGPFAIGAYRDECVALGCARDHVDSVDDVLTEFLAWQNRHARTVRLPESANGPAPKGAPDGR